MMNTQPVMTQQNWDANDKQSRMHPYVINPALRMGMPDVYSDLIAGPSTTLLMPHQGHFEYEMEDGHRKDDEAHLTMNMLSTGMGDESLKGYSLITQNTMHCICNDDTPCGTMCHHLH